MRDRGPRARAADLAANSGRAGGGAENLKESSPASSSGELARPGVPGSMPGKGSRKGTWFVLRGRKPSEPRRGGRESPVLGSFLEGDGPPAIPTGIPDSAPRGAYPSRASAQALSSSLRIFALWRASTGNEERKSTAARRSGAQGG